MKIKLGDYLIESDERQYIVKIKKIVEESRLTKKENIGNEYWQPIAYCTTFDSALKFVPQQALRSNDDILVIKEKLTQIHEHSKEYKKIEEENKKVYEKKLEAAIRDFKRKQKTEGETKNE